MIISKRWMDNSNRSKLHADSEDGLRFDVQHAIAYLQDMRLTNGAPSIAHEQKWHAGNIKRLGMVSLSLGDAWGGDVVTADKFISEALMANSDLLSHLDVGNMFGMEYVTKYNGISNPPVLTSACYYWNTIMDGVVCQDCNETLLAPEYSKHKGGPECLLKSIPLAAMRRDLVELSWQNGLEVATTKIEYDLVPTSYSVFAPKWVEMAIDAYRQNAEEYAGLSLGEFLTKMRPE